MFLQSLRLYRADKPKKNYSFLYREKNRVHRFLSNGRPKDVGVVKGGEKKIIIWVPPFIDRVGGIYNYNGRPSRHCRRRL